MATRHAAMIVVGLIVYLCALGMMTVSTPAGVTRETVATVTDAGLPCGGTLWRAAGEPKAVMLMGHGVTSNRAVMATIAKAFAANGYDTVAFDFFGHGRSRVPFHWGATGTQVAAWVAWAQAEYPDLPIAYLGHSMGGVAGFNALPGIDAEIPFVSLGMRPRGQEWPPGPVLLALGRFEQLFTPEQARQSAAQAPDGRASVLVSPWSDHALETWDPQLIAGMVDWVDGALGLPQDSVFPWGRWLLVILSVPLGMAGILTLATGVTGTLRQPLGEGATRMIARKWSVNPYRLAGLVMGVRGQATRPVAGSLVAAVPRGVLFALLCVVLLSFLLTTDMFVSRIDHPQRFLLWVAGAIMFALPFWADAHALESLPHRSAWRRFLLAALTRALPLLILSLALQLPFSPLGFLGMMFGIFAFLALMLSIVHALAVKATNDYRAAAVASAVIFTWVIAYWFPLAG